MEDDLLEKEKDLINTKEKDMLARIEKEISKKEYRLREESERKEKRAAEKALTTLKDQGREQLRKSREIHVEEMTKLESRQKEEEHRMRKSTLKWFSSFEIIYISLFHFVSLYISFVIIVIKNDFFSYSSLLFIVVLL